MDGVSPTLQTARKEIEAILKKHDIGGFISLQDGLGNGEFAAFVDTPSWSMIRFLPDGKDGAKRVHLKLYGKTKKVELERTINMLYNGQDVLGQLFMMVDHMKASIAPHIEVIETGHGVVIPKGEG